MQLEVYERGDETLMVLLATTSARGLPRSCGPLLPLGTSRVDEFALAPWVGLRLREAGYCAVVGDDASLVRLGMQGPPPAPAAAAAPGGTWLGLMGGSGTPNGPASAAR